jgi:hypothetical protein
MRWAASQSSPADKEDRWRLDGWVWPSRKLLIYLGLVLNWMVLGSAESFTVLEPARGKRTPRSRTGVRPKLGQLSHCAFSRSTPYLPQLETETFRTKYFWETGEAENE